MTPDATNWWLQIFGHCSWQRLNWLPATQIRFPHFLPSVLKMASYTTNPYNNFQAAKSKEYISLDKGAKQDFRPETRFDIIPGNSNLCCAEIKKCATQFGYGALLNVPTGRDVNPDDSNIITYRDGVTATVSETTCYHSIRTGSCLSFGTKLLRKAHPKTPHRGFISSILILISTLGILGILSFMACHRLYVHSSSSEGVKCSFQGINRASEGDISMPERNQKVSNNENFSDWITDHNLSQNSPSTEIQPPIQVGFSISDATGISQNGDYIQRPLLPPVSSSCNGGMVLSQDQDPFSAPHLINLETSGLRRSPRIALLSGVTQENPAIAAYTSSTPQLKSRQTTRPKPKLSFLSIFNPVGARWNFATTWNPHKQNEHLSFVAATVLNPHSEY